MFKKDKRKKNSSRLDTLIGQNTDIEGNVNFSGGLRVDGSITGNISTKDENAVLTLSEQGRLKGEVKAPNMVINGTITGNIYASQHLELAPQAKIHGNVYYHLLEMAVGAEINGQLIHVAEGNDDILNIDHEVIDDKNNLRLPPE
ncbi:MAG: cell shape determination protein CcmA [Gammaproteobacteria bacterium]|nr:MAG: cell shape determination protein CcmA [Gammaproteobacteria bacterium]